MGFDISKVFLITDLDGTLIPHSKILSEKDLKAIDRFRQHGGKFTIATGRIIQSASKYYDQLETDVPVILCNGGMIYDRVNNEVLRHHILGKNVRPFVEEVIEKYPFIGVELDFDKNIYVANMTDFEQMHIKLTGIKVTEKKLKDIPDGWDKVLFTMDNDFIPEFRDYCLSKNVENAVFVPSGKSFFEMLPANCSKGSSLKDLIEICGLEDYTIAAIGDFDNDIEMIKYAHIGAAPANAIDIVKENADIVMKATCNDGAVAELIEYLFEKSKEV